MTHTRQARKEWILVSGMELVNLGVRFLSQNYMLILDVDWLTKLTFEVTRGFKVSIYEPYAYDSFNYLSEYSTSIPTRSNLGCRQDSRRTATTYVY